MQDLSKFTALGRSFDLSYFTNRLILLLTILAGITAVFIKWNQGDELESALPSGLVAGGLVLLAWIIGRELDPDYDYSAFLASTFAFAGFWLFEPTQVALWPMVLTIIVARMINRSVGPAAYLIDSVGVLAIIGLVTFTGDWPVALLGAGAFLLDAVLPEPNRRHFIFAILTLVLVIVSWAVNGPGQPLTASDGWPLVAIVSFVYLVAIFSTKQVRSRADVTGQPLNATRVQVTMLFGLIVALVLALWRGDAGVAGSLALWAAILAVPVWRYLVRISGRDGVLFRTRYSHEENVERR